MAAATDIAQSSMPSIKMDPAASLPLSPTASTKDGQLTQGFDDLVHHNGTPLFTQEHFAMEPTGFPHSFQDSDRISPPVPQAPVNSHPQHGPMLYQQQHQLQQQHVYANEYTHHHDQDLSAYIPKDGVYPSPDEVCIFPAH
ncbi:hypothetical protein BD289DRAFT_35025 [Coniella lustricola]|uniref:Uncharacterized protein n=1 Tax=Coniella lustricola TaxID=2025994 RepID=A0A2T3A2E9_9PEZI|nr:hypothetical protein BD289DRAFT_35025 [Coniella lustricola]